MKNFNKYFLLVSSLFLLNACGSEKKDVEGMKTEVIAIHDEVMPKMDQVMKLKGKLKALKADTTQVISSEDSISINNLMDDLIKADNSMMDWMRNYDSQMEGMSDDEKIEYLTKQETEIKLVKQKMLSAISKSEEFLKGK